MFGVPEALKTSDAEMTAAPSPPGSLERDVAIDIPDLSTDGCSCGLA